jgi:hypothetical protein
MNRTTKALRRKLSPDEIVEVGKRLYTDSVRAKVEAHHAGQFLVLDVESGDYQIGEDDAQASLALLSRRPDAVLYGVRIGDDVAYTIGLGSTA